MRATNWRLDVWATSWTLSGEPRRAAYAAIQQNDGYISVLSELGRGSTFRIDLPVARGSD